MSGVFGFDTTNRDEGTAALCVYVVWRSRDARRLKITPEIWAQVERWTKSASKRATTIPEFLERLKPRLMCGTLQPRWMAVGISGDIPMIQTDQGLRIEVPPDDDQREFLTGVIAAANTKRVLDILYRETTMPILLVRDRLERERPVEKRFASAFAGDDDVIDGEAG